MTPKVTKKRTRRLRRLIDVRERHVSVLASVAVQAAREHASSLEEAERAQRAWAQSWAAANRCLQAGLAAREVATLGASLRELRAQLDWNRKEERRCRDRLAGAHDAVIGARNAARALRRALARATVERARHESREEARRRDELFAARHHAATIGDGA